MIKKYTQTYFTQLLERYILTVIDKEQKIIDEIAETTPEILIVPHLHKFNYIITDSFSPTETDTELIEMYESYTKFGYNIERIIELSLPIWDKYKAIAENEKRKNEAETNSTPLTEADNQEIINADILCSLFVNDKAYRSFFNALFEPLSSGKLDVLTYIQHYVMLMLKYQDAGLLNDFTNTASADEFIEEGAKVDFYVKCFFPKTNNMFANEDIYAACKSEFTALIKEMFYSAETKNRDEHRTKMSAIFGKYQKISDELQPQPIIEEKKLVDTVEKKYVPISQKTHEIQFTFEESYSVYELDFDKDSKRECLKFFIRYEALKTLKAYRYENKSVDEMMEEMEDFYKKLKEPRPPIYTVESLLNKRQETKVNLLPKEQKKEIQNPYSLLWLKNNKTAFVQLVYGLFYAKKIGLKRGKQKISETVVMFAKMTSFELGKSWQTNHSTSITKRNNDYEAEIFTKVKTAYQNNKTHFPLNAAYSVQDSEIEASNLVWKGSENELIQFVCGLYYSELIDLQKGNGDLPTIVFIFAKLMNVELSTSWMQDTVYDMLFFDTIQEGYKTYREKIKDKNDIG